MSAAGGIATHDRSFMNDGGRRHTYCRSCLAYLACRPTTRTNNAVTRPSVTPSSTCRPLLSSTSATRRRAGQKELPPRALAGSTLKGGAISGSETGEGGALAGSATDSGMALIVSATDGRDTLACSTTGGCGESDRTLGVVGRGHSERSLALWLPPRWLVLYSVLSNVIHSQFFCTCTNQLRGVRIVY